jgi:hypothetical protein
MTHSVRVDFQSDCREVLVKLPCGLPNDRYAAITHAMYSVLDVAGLANVSSVVPDRLATDSDMNAAFDRHSESYPWGC